MLPEQIGKGQAIVAGCRDGSNKLAQAKGEMADQLFDRLKVVTHMINIIIGNTCLLQAVLNTTQGQTFYRALIADMLHTPKAFFLNGCDDLAVTNETGCSIMDKTSSLLVKLEASPPLFVGQQRGSQSA